MYGGSATLPLRFSDVDASGAGGQLIDYHVPSAYRALGMARADELAVATVWFPSNKHTDGARISRRMMTA